MDQRICGSIMPVIQVECSVNAAERMLRCVCCDIGSSLLKTSELYIRYDCTQEMQRIKIRHAWWELIVTNLKG